MRQILFRGKCEFDSEWMYGWLYHSDERDGCTWILDENNESVRELFGTCDWESLWTPVVLSTVGQYIGLLDKNGTKIFEGDICKYHFEDIGDQFAVIIWDERWASFHMKPLGDFEYTSIEQGEVIGNIHDNPELLKGEI